LFKNGANLSTRQRPYARLLVSSEKHENKIVSVHISSHHVSQAIIRLGREEVIVVLTAVIKHSHQQIW